MCSVHIYMFLIFICIALTHKINRKNKEYIIIYDFLMLDKLFRMLKIIYVVT